MTSAIAFSNNCLQYLLSLLNHCEMQRFPLDRKGLLINKLSFCMHHTVGGCVSFKPLKHKHYICCWFFIFFCYRVVYLIQCDTNEVKKKPQNSVHTCAYALTHNCVYLMTSPAQKCSRLIRLQDLNLNISKNYLRHEAHS